MKKNSKLFFVAIAVFMIVLTSALIFSTLSLEEISPASQKITTAKLTGTPADNYPEKDRETHCGSGDAKSNSYIKEFEIPTPCTQPLGIVVDSSGNIWFTETNAGRVAMFDPQTNQFVEYENESWPDGKFSMMWGIALSDDNEIWFTDESNDAIWKFAIDDKKYSAYKFPGNDKGAFPQKLVINDGKFLINDFTGSKISIFDHAKMDQGELNHTSITTTEGFFTGPPAISKNGEIWFIAWKYQGETSLIKYNPLSHDAKMFDLSKEILAPNGLSIDDDGNLWIADTASSLFFKFEPKSEDLTTYITSFSKESSYGNSSGLIKTPVTRPYWNLFDDKGTLWFNEQTGNTLAAFDPQKEILVEYLIPSKNPNWADCGDMEDCGMAQVFDFVPHGDKIWFTEWVENNIGVLDTSVPLPLDVSIEPTNLNLRAGDSSTVTLLASPITSLEEEISIISNTINGDIKVSGISGKVITAEQNGPITLEISVNENSIPGEYKVLIGAEHPDVSVSKFLTVNVI